MQRVCQEVDGVMEWFYDPKEARYFKFDKNKKMCASLSGKFMPNPFETERLRLKQLEFVPPEERANYRIKCTPVTHILWQHWQKELQDGKSNN